METKISVEALQAAGWTIGGLQASRMIDQGEANPITVSVQPDDDDDDAWSVDLCQSKDPGDSALGYEMVHFNRRFYLMRELADLLAAISVGR